jgi:folate-binding protein YgfZ
MDFTYGDTFPHDAAMDQLNGVDFAKGCYVGQEVVSRVEHRGTARNRIMQITYDGFAPEVGLPIMANDKTVGTMGSATNNHGVAMVRIDRAGDALAAGIPLTAGGVALHIVKPAWARFLFPGATKPTP